MSAPPERDHDSIGGLLVSADPLPDGTYTAVLSVNGDRSRAMDPDDIRAYARTSYAVAAAAEYEQAVYAQAIATEMPIKAALALVAVLRSERPPFDHDATAPVRFVPGLNGLGEAFIIVELDGKPVGQFAATDLRHHAAGVALVESVVALDTAFRRVLVTHFGLPDRVARQTVDALGGYRR